MKIKSVSIALMAVLVASLTFMGCTDDSATTMDQAKAKQVSAAMSKSMTDAIYNKNNPLASKSRSFIDVGVGANASITYTGPLGGSIGITASADAGTWASTQDDADTGADALAAVDVTLGGFVVKVTDEETDVTTTYTLDGTFQAKADVNLSFQMNSLISYTFTVSATYYMVGEALTVSDGTDTYTFDMDLKTVCACSFSTDDLGGSATVTTSGTLDGQTLAEAAVAVSFLAE